MKAHASSYVMVSLMRNLLINEYYNIQHRL